MIGSGLTVFRIWLDSDSIWIRLRSNLNQINHDSERLDFLGLSLLISYRKKRARVETRTSSLRAWKIRGRQPPYWTHTSSLHAWKIRGRQPPYWDSLSLFDSSFLFEFDLKSKGIRFFPYLKERPCLIFLCDKNIGEIVGVR